MHISAEACRNLVWGPGCAEIVVADSLDIITLLTPGPPVAYCREVGPNHHRRCPDCRCVLLPAQRSCLGLSNKKSSYDILTLKAFLKRLFCKYRSHSPFALIKYFSPYIAASFRKNIFFVLFAAPLSTQDLD